MSFKQFSRIGILLTFALTTFFVSEAAAQDYCQCPDAYPAVSVRPAPVRRVVRTYAAKRVYRAPRRSSVAVVRYQPVYVPVQEVTAYADEDCDDAYTSSNRVVVTQRVYTSNSYPASYARNKAYTTGRYGNLIIDDDFYETRRVASDYGYADGFQDGYDAGMERDAYHPENSGDFQKATNGYEDDFGDKHIYREAYRQAYLRGYKVGFQSVSGRKTLRAMRY